MTIDCAVLMCHAPIVVPPIGGDRAAACARTTRAMRAVAAEVVRAAPDLVVLVSPHAPRDRERWGVCTDARVRGDFGRFGHRELGVSLEGAPEAATAVARAASGLGLATFPLEGDDLDHGSTVPLWFLAEAGLEAPTLIVSLPHPNARSEQRFGRALADAARDRRERWAVVASGDMSHRLTPDAPAGYDPDAARFDDAFVEHVRVGDYTSAVSLPEALRDLAAEDVVQSTTVAAAAVDFDSRGARFLAYERPFGVGYLEAVLHRREATARREPTDSDDAALLELAREAVTAAAHGRAPMAPNLPAPWAETRQAVFVTLRDARGELRGCIGRTEPALATLAEEIADCAASAALRDPRFPPVRPDELAALSFEISLLSPPEPVHDPSELDARRYGVVVTSGTRRGVLLPDLEGVDTPAEQIAIALRKAGIAKSEPYSLERFVVRKVPAKPHATSRS